eukprot:scaffold89939_cov54-Attheya_sp.AAC.2
MQLSAEPSIQYYDVDYLKYCLAAEPSIKYYDVDYLNAASKLCTFKKADGTAAGLCTASYRICSICHVKRCHNRAHNRPLGHDCCKKTLSATH